MAINLIIAGFFFSVQKSRQASIISISRGIVIKAMAIFLVPMIFGKSAVWFPPLVAEVLTLFIALYIFKKDKKIFEY